MLSYTVTEDGKSKDPKVDWSLPEGSTIFRKEAIEAVLKTEHFPALVDGNPVEMPDFKTILLLKWNTLVRIWTRRLKDANKLTISPFFTS